MTSLREQLAAEQAAWYAAKFDPAVGAEAVQRMLVRIEACAPADADYRTWFRGASGAQRGLADFDVAADPVAFTAPVTLSSLAMLITQLLRSDGTHVEAPRQLMARIAGALLRDAPAAVRDRVYRRFMAGEFVPGMAVATGAGLRGHAMAACYIIGVHDDSLAGIQSAHRRALMGSSYGGGIGVYLGAVRSPEALVARSQCPAHGLESVLRVFHEYAKATTRGINGRTGAMAVYVDILHPQVDLVMRLVGDHMFGEQPLSTLTAGVNVRDVVMRAFLAKAAVKVLDPCTVLRATGVADLFAQPTDVFEAAYADAPGRAVPAADLLRALNEARVQTGRPLVCFIDTFQRIGVMRGQFGQYKTTNLCTEIVQPCGILRVQDAPVWTLAEFGGADEIEFDSVCVLLSMGLPRFVRDGCFDYDAFGAAVEDAMLVLAGILDETTWPTPESSRGARWFRPVGLGPAGLADCLIDLGLRFGSREAAAFVARMSEVRYFHALRASCRLARQRERFPAWNHSVYATSPATMFAFERCKRAPSMPRAGLDWDALRDDIRQHGLYFSTHIACMPTATGGEALGYSAGIDPLHGLIVRRENHAGSVVGCNPRVARVLASCNVTRVAHSQSLQREALPAATRDVLRTGFEIDPFEQLMMAAAAQPFVDQGQSVNLFLGETSGPLLNGLLVAAWEWGLATLYYLRTNKQGVVLDEVACEACAT